MASNAIEFLDEVIANAQTLKDQLTAMAALQENINSLTTSAPATSEGPTNGAAKRGAPNKKALAGKYMAFVRRLSETDKEKVRAIREESGIRKAITEAKRIVRAAEAP